MQDTENPLGPFEKEDGNGQTQADEQVEPDAEVSPKDRLRRSTQEQLANKDWISTVPIVSECYDRIHTIREKQLTLTQKIGKEKQTKTTLEDQLAREKSDLQKFEAIVDAVQRGDHNVDLSYLGNTLFYLLLTSCNYYADQQSPARTILDKASSQRKDGDELLQHTATLSESELVFLKDQFPTYRQTFEENISDLTNKIESSSRRILGHQEELEKLMGEINEQNIVLRAALDVLDEREISEGAPDYADETADPEQKFQAYVARIQWRTNRLKEKGRPVFNWPGRQELGDNWAMFVKIGNDYKLLNPGQVTSPLYAHSLIRYRVPGTTTAVHSNSLIVTNKVHAMAVIDNGIIQDRTYNQLQEVSLQLEREVPDMKYKIR